MNTKSLYEQFMDAVDRFDESETDEARQKWMETAEALYGQLAEQINELTGAQQRRVKRTISYLRDVGEIKDEA